MNIFEKYKSDSYFEIKVSLDNENELIIKWNIFKDKKNNFHATMRPRYILFDKDGARLSLKTLELTKPVVFKELEINNHRAEWLEYVNAYNQREIFIFTHFGDWLNTDFKAMIESGGCKIIGFRTNPLKK